VTWDEVVGGAGGAGLAFTADEVLDRVEVDGDLFAPVLDLEQWLPAGG
jgi:hypothetical protein